VGVKPVGVLMVLARLPMLRYQPSF